MKYEKVFASFVLSLGILFSGYFISKSIFYIKDFERSVKVKGLDERIVKSNLGIWTFSFSQSGDNLFDVYKIFSSSQDKIINFLISKGFKKDEIEKTGLEITDNRTVFGPDVSKSRPKYSGNSRVIVSSSNVDLIKTISQVTAELIEKGVVLYSSEVKFLFTDLNSVKTEMLNSAVKNAFEAAKSFATQSGSKLGSIKNATQGLFTIVDANSTEEWVTTKSIEKKVRVVVGVDYFLQ